MRALAGLIDAALIAGQTRVEGSGEALDTTAFGALAAHFAQSLGAAPLLPSEPVHIVIGNRPRDLAALLGIWRAGGVAVPVHASTPDAVHAALQARTKARFAVDGAEVRQIADDPPPPRPLLQDAAVIVFTSGSTGEPKGVVLGHDRLAGKLAVLARILNIHIEDAIIAPLQLNFIFGIWVGLLTMMSGAHLVLLPRFSVEAARESFREGATVFGCVPTMLRMLMAEESIAAPKLRMILTGGEPLGAALGRTIRAKLPNAAMFDLFGLTETGSCDFCLAPSDQPQGLGTIGKPTENVAFRIAADGASGGELQIKTPYGMLGYLDNPALTESAFSDGFFCTGDLARLREDGRVELVGRAKEIVSRAGHKIAPLEIDGLLAEHPDVAAALTAGVPDAQVGERLHVVVVARPGAALDEAALRAWAAERIERYKLPDTFHFRDALPLGRTGKADRGAVARLVQETAKCGREIQL
jgi:long-chain acyl-CoA synthetase